MHAKVGRFWVKTLLYRADASWGIAAWYLCWYCRNDR